MAEGIVAVKNCAKTEGKYDSAAETVADYAGMFEHGSFGQLALDFNFTDYNAEIPTGVTENGAGFETLNAADEEWPTTSDAGAKKLLLGDAVCVPRHVSLSTFEPGRLEPSRFFAKPTL